MSYALTLHRPWPWAILVAGKRLENRSWYRASIRGRVIALHAGKAWDPDGALFIDRITDLERPPGWEHPASAIVGACRVGTVWTKCQNVDLDQRRWFMGPCAWVLDEVVAFAEPIPNVRGKQGLWHLTDEQERAFQSALAR